MAITDRTGWVRITFTDLTFEVVRADSFGEAASKVFCGDGRILRFNWVTGDTEKVSHGN